MKINISTVDDLRKALDGFSGDMPVLLGMGYLLDMVKITEMNLVEDDLMREEDCKDFDPKYAIPTDEVPSYINLYRTPGDDERYRLCKYLLIG